MGASDVCINNLGHFGLGNGLLYALYQAIIYTNDDVLLIGQ